MNKAKFLKLTALLALALLMTISCGGSDDTQNTELYEILPQINGVYYNLNYKDKTAAVVNIPYNDYTGSIIIPEYVISGEKTYRVTSIGDNAFGDCTGLTSISIPNSVTSIGAGAFGGCTGLTSISIPNSVTGIGDYAFSDCTGLTSISIPNSVVSIGDRAFYGCPGLTSISIPNSVKIVGNGVFENCTGLTSISIPNSVVSIGDRAFYSCPGLTSISIPNSVTSIGYSAFWGCTGLTSIIIPGSVTNIGLGLFSGCTALTSIVVDSQNKKYDSRNNCNAIIETSSNNLIIGCQNSTIPNNVTMIERWAFERCTNLTTVTIPNSVTNIEFGAFQYCTNLTTVIIGNGIKDIQACAFDYCQKLSDVTCYALNVPNTSGGAFGYSSIGKAILHVPSTSVDAYKVVTPWMNFKNIIGDATSGSATSEKVQLQ